MAEIIERLTGRTLDDLANEYIFDPLKMSIYRFPPGEKIVAGDRADRNRQQFAPSPGARRSSRRKRFRHRRSLRPCRSFQHRAGSRGILPDVAERWQLWASANFEPLHRRGVHRRRNSFRTVRARSAGRYPPKAAPAATSSPRTVSATLASPAHPSGSIQTANSSSCC